MVSRLLQNPECNYCHSSLHTVVYMEILQSKVLQSSLSAYSPDSKYIHTL